MRKINDLSILEVYNYYKMLRSKDRLNLRSYIYEFNKNFIEGELQLIERFKYLTNLQFLAARQSLY